MQTQAKPVAPAPAGASSSDAVRKHKQYLFLAVTMYYKEPIALERGEGAYVWDDQGNKYLDCFGGVLTVSVDLERMGEPALARSSQPCSNGAALAEVLRKADQ